MVTLQDILSPEVINGVLKKIKPVYDLYKCHNMKYATFSELSEADAESIANLQLEKFNRNPDFINEQPKELTKCICDILQLMKTGCICGFIEIERKNKCS